MKERGVKRRLTSNLKKKWIEALTSGEYKQGSAALCDNGKYCCLGVLQEIAPARGVRSESYLATGYNTNAARPMPNDRFYRLPPHVQSELAKMNDEGVPFEVIAGFIQENIHVRP